MTQGTPRNPSLESQDSSALAEASHHGFLASVQRCLDCVVALTSRQVFRLLLLLGGVTLHPPRKLRAPLLSGWPCPTLASRARSSQRPTSLHPVAAPRSQQGLPRPPHRASIIVPKDSGFWSTVSVGLSVLTSTTTLFPPSARSTKTILSFQVSTVPVLSSPRGLLLRPSNPDSRLKPLAPGAFAHAVPSLGVSLLGFGSSSFLFFPDILDTTQYPSGFPKALRYLLR